MLVYYLQVFGGVRVVLLINEEWSESMNYFVC